MLISGPVCCLISGLFGSWIWGVLDLGCLDLPPFTCLFFWNRLPDFGISGCCISRFAISFSWCSQLSDVCSHDRFEYIWTWVFLDLGCLDFRCLQLGSSTVLDLDVCVCASGIHVWTLYFRIFRSSEFQIGVSRRLDAWMVILLDLGFPNVCVLDLWTSDLFWLWDLWLWDSWRCGRQHFVEFCFCWISCFQNFWTLVLWIFCTFVFDFFNLWASGFWTYGFVA